jgi:hypothetical protein
VRHYHRLVVAWVDGSEATTVDAALESLGAAAADAEKHGSVRRRLWAEYTRARVEALARRPGAAAAARAVARDARATGFVLIAQRADALARAQ